MNDFYIFLKETLPYWMTTPVGILVGFGIALVVVMLAFFIYYRLFSNKVINSNSPLMKDCSPVTAKKLQQQRVTNAIIKQMYEIFQSKDISPNEYDKHLSIFAERFENLRVSLNTPESEDIVINKLKERAWQAIEKGDFERAEELLLKAYKRDLAAAKDPHELPKSRLLSSANVLSQLGSLHTLKLNYIKAAEEYEVAAQRVPEGEIYEQFRMRYLNRSGIAYLNAQAYDKAEIPLIQALELRENTAPPPDSEMASVTSLFANTFADTDAETAERMFKRSLEIEERNSVEEGYIDPEYAVTLTNLANLYLEQEYYQKAEALYQEALKIRQQIYGDHHEEIASSLTDLAELYHIMGDFDSSETHHLKSIVEREAAQGPEHPDLAFNLINLGLLYQQTKQYKKAGSLYRRAIKIQESALGAKHPDLAIGLHNLASLLQEIGKYDKSEEIYKKALRISKKTYGNHHPHIAQTLTDLGSLYSNMNRFEEAEENFQQAIEIWEKIKGPKDTNTANAYRAYAIMLYDQEKIDQAELYESKARKVLGNNNPVFQ